MQEMQVQDGSKIGERPRIKDRPTMDKPVTDDAPRPPSASPPPVVPPVASVTSGAKVPPRTPARADRRWPMAGLVVLALLALAAWALSGRGTVVKVATVMRGDAAEVVYATGIVEPVRWASVSALSRKRIAWMCQGCEGQAVKKGEVLARLDDGEERAQLAEIEARLARTREDAARMEALVRRNVTARITLDEKLTQVRELEARVAAQKDRILDLELKAPMDGFVLRRDGQIGEIAGTGPNDVLFWVGEKTPLRVVSDVNEDDILRVREGQTVLLRHEGQNNGTLRAQVESVTPKGDPQSKTFRVFLALPDTTPLRIGMSVEANIVSRESLGTLVLPAEAVSDGVVQVVARGRVVRQKVETGIRGTAKVEIKGGVAEGQQVVSPFQAALKDNARVKYDAGVSANRIP